MKKNFQIILPVFNEYELIETFLKLVEKVLSTLDVDFKLIIVDDGSIDSTVEIIKNFEFIAANISLELLQLSSNQGHQNAIREGIIHVSKKTDNTLSGIIIMDADGEDDPEAIKELISIQEFDIVFVSRGKRKESTKFKIGYFIYKILFRLITGKTINFGNYSLLSPRVIRSISKKHFFHYSAFLSKQKFDIKKINYNRQKRIDGSSKMAFKNLLFHALKSFIEYAEEVVFFQLKIFACIFVILTSTGIYILYSKFIAKNAIIGWSSTLLVGLLNSLLIMLSSIIISTLLLSIKNTLDQKNNTENLKK